MMIDMHTHTFPDKIAERTLEKLSKLSGTVYYTSGTETGLISSMKNAKIDYSVILPVATSTDQVDKINNKIIETAKERKMHGIFSFGAMHPDYEFPEKACMRLADAGIRGIKLHPAYTDTDFDDPRFLRILKACSENHLAVTVHAGIDIGIPHHNYCSTSMIQRILSQIPDLTLILAHMGGWRCWDEVIHNLLDAPVLFDTSFSFGPIQARADREPSSIPPLMTNEDFTAMCRLLGSNRILFGSDSPWGDQINDIERIQSLSLTDSEKQDILENNARKLLKL